MKHSFTVTVRERSPGEVARLVEDDDIPWSQAGLRVDIKDDQLLATLRRGGRSNLSCHLRATISAAGHGTLIQGVLSNHGGGLMGVYAVLGLLMGGLGVALATSAGMANVPFWICAVATVWFFLIALSHRLKRRARFGVDEFEMRQALRQVFEAPDGE